MISNKNLRYIHIDAIKVVTILVALQGLLGESIIVKYFYFEYLEIPMMLGVLFFSAYEIHHNIVNNKSLKYVFLPFIIGLYTAYKLSNKSFVFLTILLIFCNAESIEKIIKTIYRVTQIFFWSHFILFLFYIFFHIGQNDYVIYDELGAKYGMFTYNPNTIARVFIFYIALSCFVHNMKLPNIRWILVFVITYIMYYYTRSDALYLVGICFFLSKIKVTFKLDAFMTGFVKYGVLILTIFSFSMFWAQKVPFLYQFISKLDILMSDRLTSNLKAMAIYGITLFGKNSLFGKTFEYQGISYQWIYADNMYVYMLVHWGVVYLLFLFLLLFLTANKMDFKSKVMVFVLLMYGIGENGVINLYSCFSIMIAFSTLVKNNSKKKDVLLPECE